ncbi:MULTISPECIES: hypothetical protein [Streptomyces]|uniref:Uncharacterized protein n=1 Tax=Streptomyces harbinensis TaxID=1176198 RepID=A0A1I6WAI7_9ACTN|nr:MULTISPECIES: hypothetical protein [Streptomyces]SFT23009.1 hypothetical protein SAMN05444716_11621 [Streptomyces harbinensis]
MQFLDRTDHRIAGTDHATLLLAEGVLVIADWELTEQAPDSDGRVYISLRGWAANVTGSGDVTDPYTAPVQAGRAHLVRADLRGRQPVIDRHVHLDYYPVGGPGGRTWDHPGYLATVTWADRRVDSNGDPIHEDEIGRTEWTDPATGRTYDLTDEYLPAGTIRRAPHQGGLSWRHFDRWSGGVPVLQLFVGDNTMPSRDSKLITDGEWVRLADAPEFKFVEI